MSEIATKEDILAHGRSFVEDLMREKGEVNLMIVAHLPNNQIMAFPLAHLWTKSTILRDIAIAAVRSEMIEAEALCYLVVAEAWMVDYRTARDIGVRESIREIGAPSEHPDRIEVVSLIAGDATGTVGAVYRLVRKASGKFSHLEEYQMPGMGPVVTDGRFSDLLVDKSKVH